MIYPHSLKARTILVKADAPSLAFPRMVLMQRRDIDVRLGVNRDLNFAVLVNVQETN